MKLHTASEVISFARELENESTKFYQDLSEKYAQDKDVFLSFAEENRKNVKQVERVYYGVITDAIEGCFAFSVDSDDYRFDATLGEKASYSDALNKAVEIEEKMVRFYSDAAEQSESLLADIPRTFMMIAKRRNNRMAKLSGLFGKEGL